MIGALPRVFFSRSILLRNTGAVAAAGELT